MNHVFSRGSFSSNGFTRNQNVQQVEKNNTCSKFEEELKMDFCQDKDIDLNYDELDNLNFWGIYHTKSGSFNEKFFQPADR